MKTGYTLSKLHWCFLLARIFLPWERCTQNVITSHLYLVIYECIRYYCVVIGNTLFDVAVALQVQAFL